MKAHSTNTNTNTDTNTDLPILKILRFVNFGRKLLRPNPLESVPVKVKVKVFLRIIFVRKLAISHGWCTRLENFTDRHLANENDSRLYNINKN